MATFGKTFWRKLTTPFGRQGEEGGAPLGGGGGNKHHPYHHPTHFNNASVSLQDEQGRFPPPDPNHLSELDRQRARAGREPVGKTLRLLLSPAEFFLSASALSASTDFQLWSSKRVQLDICFPCFSCQYITSHNLSPHTLLVQASVSFGAAETVALFSPICHYKPLCHSTGCLSPMSCVFLTSEINATKPTFHASRCATF